MLSESKHNEFTAEEKKILKEVFHICENPTTHHVDAIELSVILRLMDSKVSDLTLHSLVRNAVGSDGTLNIHLYEKLLDHSRSSFTSLNLSHLVQDVKKVKEESGFYHVIQREFPGFMNEYEFVEKSYTALSKHGFTKSKTFACVALCRDEICKPLERLLLETWGDTFELSSLGGMLLAGKTGITAAINHAPETFSHEHYLFVCMPHIAIDEIGNIGAVYRPGRAKSHACGALVAFKQEYDGPGRMANVEIDHADIEYSVMKQKLMKVMDSGSKPSLVELTKLAQKVILKDLEHLIALCVDTRKANYAVISGVQIHGPKGVVRNKDTDFVWLTDIYVVKQGSRVDVKLH